MRGRLQASMVATLATGTVFFAWLGAAIIALVILRRGLNQGIYVLFWALLPAIMWVIGGGIGPFATVLSVVMAATVLRATQSWSWTLVVASLTGLIVGVLVMLFGETVLDQREQIMQTLNETLARLAEESGAAQPLPWELPTIAQLAGSSGLSAALTASVSIVLARWWQAQLYNPGGFKAEFVTLRMTPRLTLVLLVAIFTFVAMGADYWSWALIFALPLTFAGFALVHAVAQIRQVSKSWLVMFYLGWLFLAPFQVTLLVVAVADSWLDFRKRLNAE